MGSNDLIDLWDMRATEGWRERGVESEMEMERLCRMACLDSQSLKQNERKVRARALKWKGLHEDLMCAEYTKSRHFIPQSHIFSRNPRQLAPLTLNLNQEHGGV